MPFKLFKWSHFSHTGTSLSKMVSLNIHNLKTKQWICNLNLPSNLTDGYESWEMTDNDMFWKQIYWGNTGHQVELISSMTITSKVSYKRKIGVPGTSEKAEGVMRPQVSSCRSRYKGTIYRILPSIVRYLRKESLSCLEAVPRTTGGALYLKWQLIAWGELRFMLYVAAYGLWRKL